MPHEPVAPKPITSLQNDRVKAIRALEMRKVRKETGLFVAEGTSILVTAREHGFIPETLVYRAGTAASGIARGLVAWSLEAGAECLEVSEAVLGKLASKDNPQSMLAVFRQRWADAAPAAKIDRAQLWLALEEVRDPGNLGTIIRTADAVGASGVILIGQSCDPYSRECARATMGSIFAVPLVKHDARVVPGLARGLGRRRRRHASRWSRRFPQGALPRADAARDGQRGPGPVGAGCKCVQPAGQDSHGRPARFTQPRRCYGVDALPDPRP